MRKIVTLLLVTSALTACSGITPIAELRLPPTQTIKGKIVEKNDAKAEFTLQDASGFISVDVDDEETVKNLYINEEVTVSGVADEDDSMWKQSAIIREFDAYTITRQNGDVINIIP